MALEDPNPRTPDDDSLIKGGNWLSKRIENYIARATPSCTEMTHLLSEEMDHPLPWFTRFKMRVHFLMCCYCWRYKMNLHYLRKVFRSSASDEISSSSERLPLEAKERLKQAVRDHQR